MRPQFDLLSCHEIRDIFRREPWGEPILSLQGAILLGIITMFLHRVAERLWYIEVEENLDDPVKNRRCARLFAMHSTRRILRCSSRWRVELASTDLLMI